MGAMGMMRGMGGMAVSETPELLYLPFFSFTRAHLLVLDFGW